MALDKATAISPLYFCHGGTHSFTFEAQAHSAWINQGVCLKEPPGKTLPLSAAPGIGAFQKFEEAGATWTITCPSKGPAAPVETFQLWGQTEFTSPAYKIDVSLGHHRLDFVDVSGNEQFQVIEYGEETTLQAREISYYTQAAMPFSAKWKLGEQDLQPAEPGDNGWVTPYTFKPATQAIHQINVSVPSLYYKAGYFRKEIPVHALAKTPWNNNATLEVNNKPVTDTRKPGVICTRSTSNTLKLLNPDLLLKDSLLTLSSASDLAALGITIADLDVAKPLTGPELPWLIESSPSAGKSGWFELDLTCSKLKKDWENITGRVISANLADEVPGITVREQRVSTVGALFFREESAPLTLTFEPWMHGLKVALDEEDAPSGTHYEPPLKAFLEVPDNLTLTWAVTAGSATGMFKLKATCEDTTTALTLNSRVISKLTADAFESIKINGVALDDLSRPELVFFRAETHILELQPKSGGPLPGMKVALIAGDLNSDLGITFDPPLGESNTQDIPSNGSVKWTITGGGKSGFFDLQFKFTETDEVFPLPCRVLSRNLNDEADVKINGLDVSALGHTFIKGQAQVVTFTPKENSPLQGYSLNLQCTLNGTLQPEDIVSEPIFGENNNYRWTLMGSTNSGTFILHFMVGGFTPMNILCRLRSEKLADEFKSMIVSGLYPSYELQLSEPGLVVHGPGSSTPQHEIKFMPFPQGPLAGLNMKITWQSGDLNAEPDSIMSGLNINQEIKEAGTVYTWKRPSSIIEGIFQLMIHCDGETFIVPGISYSQWRDALTPGVYHEGEFYYTVQLEALPVRVKRDGNTKPVRVVINKESPLFKLLPSWTDQVKISVNSEGPRKKVILKPPSGSAIPLNAAKDEFIFEVGGEAGFSGGGSFIVKVTFPYNLSLSINCWI